MSYQVIARKFRPQVFDQLVGQDHVTTTLRNALQEGRLHHALLFTGPRGTGKTSSARILAKSLRCPNATNFVPCNQCVSCEDIALGRSLDVIEIDGASNNGVDAVRELRDTVGFMPSSGNYKIYIIDEVHMLSTAAFNALLKTLEEPPAHVIFVLATTEVHKLPATILSRLQRYDFRRIPTRLITEQLQMICQNENVTVEEDALWMIARQADGSMRDSQSLLEQVITFSSGEVTQEKTSSILGLTDHALLREALMAIVSRTPGALGAVFEKMNEVAIDYSLFIDNLIQDLRHLSMVRVFDQEAQSYIDRPDSDIRLFQDLASQVDEGDLQILFDMALKGASDVQRASEPRWALEMVLLRMASAPRWIDFQNLHQILRGGALPEGMTSAPMGAPASAPVGHGPSVSARPAARPAPAASTKPQKLRADLPPPEKWFEFVQKVKKTDSLLAAKLEPLHFVRIDEGSIELAVPGKMSFLRDQLTEKNTQAKLEGLIEQWWGQPYKVIYSVAMKEVASAPTAKKIASDKARQKESELLSQAAAHPKVAAFNKVFQGRVQGFVNKGEHT